MDEAELIGAAQGGDRAAFDELVRRTFVDTFTLRAGSRATRRTRATWCKTPTCGPGGASGSSAARPQFSTWMYRITANAAATHVRKRRRQRTEPFDDDVRAGRRPARGAARVAMAESADALERIAPALDELPPKLRASSC